MEWIPVEQQLPDDSSVVVVVDEYGNINFGFYSSDDTEYVPNGWYFCDAEHMIECTSMRFQPPMYWLPLPALPSHIWKGK